MMINTSVQTASDCRENNLAKFHISSGIPPLFHVSCIAPAIPPLFHVSVYSSR